MAIQAVAHHFGLDVTPCWPDAPAEGAKSVTWQAIVDSYDPLADTKELRNNPEQFEALRNHYNLRHEVNPVS